MKNNKYIFSMITCILLAILLVGCGTKEDNSAGSNDEKASGDKVGKNPIVTITMENDEQIKLELYPNIAPNTVANFVSLVEKGFYDGLIFHRVIPGFMIQGGDPDGIGTGGPGYGIKGEFSSNGFDNELKHERGVISMARSQSPDSAGSQFFIMVEDAASLDGEYAAFGKVTEGMETADNIVKVTTEQEKPVEDQKMKTVTVETFGEEYEDPEVTEE